MKIEICDSTSNVIIATLIAIVVLALIGLAYAGVITYDHRVKMALEKGYVIDRQVNQSYAPADKKAEQ